MPTIETRKSDDGKITYRVKVRLKGHPVQTATFDRKTDAKKWAQDIESAIRQRRYFPTTEARRRTLQELAEKYIATVAPTLRSASDRVRHLEWWKKRLGSYFLADISTAMIADERDHLLISTETRSALPRKPATVVRYLASLSHAFAGAKKEWQWVDVNPVLNVKKPREPRGRIRFLNVEQRERLLEACGSSKNRYLYSAVVVTLHTGLRLSELMGLEWADVDLTKQRVVIRDSKNEDSRAVPLVGLALAAMQKHSKVRRLDSLLVFPRRGPKGRTRPANMRAPWLAALHAANIEDFHWHDMRHDAASSLLTSGATLSEVGEILGHRCAEMTKRYSHLAESHARAVLERMSQKVFGQ